MTEFYTGQKVRITAFDPFNGLVGVITEVVVGVPEFYVVEIENGVGHFSFDAEDMEAYGPIDVLCALLSTDQT